jgi:4'-phosphopantetheinyl transferase
VCLLRLGDESRLQGLADQILSADERAKISRYHRHADRSRSTLAWLTVRLVLAQKLKCAPRSIAFVDGRYGKKTAQGAASRIRFNISHSGELVAVAFSVDDIGIDVERVEAVPDFLNIARAQFHPVEYRHILSSSEQDRLAAFFAIWTRKEALVKGLGAGLNIPTDSFAVPIGQGSAAPMIAQSVLWQTSTWQLMDLDIRTGYRCSVAVRADAMPQIVAAWLTEAQLVALAQPPS